MHFRLNCRLIAPCVAVSLLVFTGCASSPSQSVSLPIWQKAVEQYVREAGQGDPSALGDVTLPDGRHGFAVLGDPIVKNSTDAVGVLLGHRPLNGKLAFIYLVGVVE